MSEWPELIKRYACGKSICNCGNAYYTEEMRDVYYYGAGYKHEMSKFCQYGCQANQDSAKGYIAKKVLEELNHPLLKG